MLENGLTLLFPFLMIYAAWSDLFSMTISNKVSLALMASFMCFAVATGMSIETIAWHWALFGVVLSVCFVLFAIGAMGGGDAKLAASTALWFGWEHVMAYVYLSSIIGAILTIAIVLFRGQTLPPRLMNVEWIQRIYHPKSGIPYGIALGAAAMLVYPHTEWMQLVYETAIVN